MNIENITASQREEHEKNLVYLYTKKEYLKQLAQQKRAIRCFFNENKHNDYLTTGNLIFDVYKRFYKKNNIKFFNFEYYKKLFLEIACYDLTAKLTKAECQLPAPSEPV